LRFVYVSLSSSTAHSGSHPQADSLGLLEEISADVNFNDFRSSKDLWLPFYIATPCGRR
jgi:hypothetical protein